jgi:hypothetical protein
MKGLTIMFAEIFFGQHTNSSLHIRIIQISVV